MIYKEMNPKIVCNDGFSISVQASQFHYCEPRMDFPGVPYSHVECGYPSANPGAEMVEYQESRGHNDPTDDVYPYVPVEVVQRMIDSHGGIREGGMPFYEEVKV